MTLNLPHVCQRSVIIAGMTVHGRRLALWEDTALIRGSAAHVWADGTVPGGVESKPFIHEMAAFAYGSPYYG